MPDHLLGHVLGVQDGIVAVGVLRVRVPAGTAWYAGGDLLAVPEHEIGTGGQQFLVAGGRGFQWLHRHHFFLVRGPHRGQVRREPSAAHRSVLTVTS